MKSAFLSLFVLHITIPLVSRDYDTTMNIYHPIVSDCGVQAIALTCIDHGGKVFTWAATASIGTATLYTISSSIWDTTIRI